MMKTDSVDLSIIIPVYNAESFIHECINSILNQKNSSLIFEIILVNDGSTDGSLQILNSYAKKYSMIKVLNQPNQRQGQARNNGLNHSRGKYIWFVDADDWIYSESFAVLEPLIIKSYDAIDFESADIIDGHIVRKMDRKHLSNKVVSGLMLLNDNLAISSVVTRTLYKRSFLLENNLYQLPGVFFEDVDFAPRAYYFAKKVFVLNMVLYYIRQNENSTTRSFNPLKSIDLVKVCRSLDQFILDFIKNNNESCCFSEIIARSINSSLANAIYLDDENQEKYNKLIKNNLDLLDHFLKSRKLKYMIEWVVFKLHPNNVLLGYKRLRTIYKTN